MDLSNTFFFAQDNLQMYIRPSTCLITALNPLWLVSPSLRKTKVITGPLLVMLTSSLKFPDKLQEGELKIKQEQDADKEPVWLT